MEYYWTLFNNSNPTSCTNRAVGAAAAHNVGNSNSNNNNTWESWELAGAGNNAGGSGSGVSRVDWSYPFHNSSNYAPQFTDGSVGGGGGKEYQPVYYRPDPHLACLKLGKRHYFEHVTAPPMAVVGRSVSKKGKPYLAGTTEIDATSAAVVVVPRCQVEGCDVVLVNAKEYHRRHKVCEMHAKAPKVVVLGMEQRFCQQCSRFHAVAEFDETKRSCRRRLAGHNERRRKSSQEQHSLAKKVPYQDMKTMIGTASTHPQYLLNSRDCALSLLSSPNYTFPYNINPNALPPPPSSTADLPSRCSAALRELIAENRASILAFRQLMNPNNYQIEDDYNNNNSTFKPGSDPQENGGHVTLDLMQAPTSAFGAFSVHDHKSSSKTGGNEEDNCSELWKVPNLGNY